MMMHVPEPIMAVVSSHPTHEARGVDIKISMPVAALPRTCVWLQLMAAAEG